VHEGKKEQEESYGKMKDGVRGETEKKAKRKGVKSIINK
jgi:hypothetical protein